MTIFLAPLAAGLVGLAAMALPGLRRHGHGAHAHGLARVVPEPRTVFSVLALEGAFGNLLVALGLGDLAAGLVALVPAALVEVTLVRSLYRLLLGFEGRPSTPLAALEAEVVQALSEFNRGRGIVEAVRDGRSIQLVAQLVEDQRSLPVHVGERLQVISVDVDQQRVTVSLV